MDDPGCGQDEVYFQRNGKFYFSEFVDANFISPNTFAPEFADEWALPDENTSSFDFPDGEFKI